MLISNCCKIGFLIIYWQELEPAGLYSGSGSTKMIFYLINSEQFVKVDVMKKTCMLIAGELVRCWYRIYYLIPQYRYR